MISTISSRTELYSYGLSLFWLFFLLIINSVPVLCGAAVFLTGVSIYRSILYFKKLRGASRKEDFIRERVFLFSTCMFLSILICFFKAGY